MNIPIGTSGTSEIQYMKYTSEYILKLQIHQHEDLEETKILNIGEVSKDDDEHNSAIDKNDIHYEEKQGGDVKECTDEDEAEEGYSDCGLLF